MKAITKIAAVVAAGALSVSLIGCGSGESSNDAPDKEYTTAEISAQDIEIEQTGFTVMSDGSVNYAFIIKNPNTDYIAKSLTFNVEGYGADGLMLMSGGETVNQVLPGKEFAVAGNGFVPDPQTAIDRLEVVPNMATTQWVKVGKDGAADSDKFSVYSSNNERLDDGTLKISAVVGCDFGSEGESAGPVEAHAVAVLKDASGNLLGGVESNGIMFDQSMVNGGGANMSGLSDSEKKNIVDDPNVAVTQVIMTIPGAPEFKECVVNLYPGM